jgi:gamma-glutamyltranspeptidase/glutathione hydrolase
MKTPRLKRCRLAVSVCLLALLATPGAPAQEVRPYIDYDTIHHPIKAYHGMAVSQNRYATLVGRHVLQKGGNAVDAAVAMGFVLAVTLPRAGNIGGSGFMLIHLADEHRTIALDYRATAPLSSSEADYRDKSGDILWDKLTYGPHASALPGTVAGLHEAWRRFGTMPWADLVQPAIDLAENGLPVSTDLNFALNEAGRLLAATPSTAAIYLRPDGYAWQPGQRLVQKDLAWSLKQIQQGGAEAFYRGELAERIVKAYNDAGRALTMEDLASYRVREREPVATDYRGYRVVSMPLSSAGGVTLIQMLNMLKHFDVKKLDAGSAKSIHLLAEVMKRAAANRRTHLGDPDFVEVNVDAYISEALGKSMAAKIDMRRAAKVKNIEPEDLQALESRDTTHFSVMDAEGNAVSNTYTLGYSFGSGWVAQGTGILMDNQMRNYSFRDGEDHPNALKPGKRVLSTMTPTIVLDDQGQVYLVTGTPGGSRIINVVLQIIVNVIDHGLDVAEATQRPRIYQGWRSQWLGLEPGVSPDTARILENMGHEIRWEQAMGSTQSIMIKDGKFYGAADTRRPDALASGPIVPPQPEAAQATGTDG